MNIVKLDLKIHLKQLKNKIFVAQIACYDKRKLIKGYC